MLFLSLLLTSKVIVISASDALSCMHCVVRCHTFTSSLLMLSDHSMLVARCLLAMRELKEHAVLLGSLPGCQKIAIFSWP